jgi:DNA polymerase-1
MSNTPESTPSKKLVLIDGNSLLFRGFFAMRTLTTSAGQPTNAVYSFTMMLLTLLESQKPDLIISAWDRHEPTFRHDEFAEYKGQRAPTPPELIEQGPLARELVQTFNVPMVEAIGYEADDIIGTLAKQGRELGYSVLIVTGDLDALQLVEPGVRVMTTIKGVTDTVIYDDDAVFERYGLRPNQLADYRALKGDTSDNIPGVPGIGEKTAAQLLQEFGTVEELLTRLDEVTQKRAKAALEEGREQIALSKRLAVIVRDVPLPDVTLPPPDEVLPYTPDYTAIRALFDRLEFRTLARRVEKMAEQKNSSDKSAKSTAHLESPDYDPFADTGETTPPPARANEVTDFRDVTTLDAFAQMQTALQKAYSVGISLHTTGESLWETHLCGIAFATGEGVAYYVPCATNSPTVPPSDFGGLFEADTSPEATPLVPLREQGALGARVADLLESPALRKVTHDCKTTVGVLERYGVYSQGIVFDTELAAYLLNAGRRASFPLHEIAGDYAGRELMPLDKKERKTKSAEEIAEYEKQQTLLGADAILEVMKVQEPRLSAEGLTSVLNDLEIPVAPVLAEMELAGIAVDVPTFQRLSRELGEKMADLEAEIFTQAGEEFLISSPKQLQVILFEKLKLPTGKKTKTGYSTDADVLEELAGDYPIVSLILQHRELAKLKSTYADAMPTLVRADGRIHTSLNQTVAATGRLSSSNPNLQNIPIRTEIGREIRRAFVAPSGLVLVSADYSQIELRIFAHVSEDAELIAAFTSGEDIHKYTASKIYGVSVSDVTSDMRRASKTVNYAVIYGISDFALARQLKIPQSQAKELKESYFARFPGVKRYIDETIQFARDKGYVQTLFGRKRYMPDINSRVFQFRQAAERAASNMPIQGTSADIMKRAMVLVHHRLQETKLQSRMLLQVHDELLFEAPPEEVTTLAHHVQECMMGAKQLAVTLDVDVKTGGTWADVTPIT